MDTEYRRKKVDLQGFSKQQLSFDIATDLERQLQLLEISEADLAAGESLNLKMLGFEDCPYFTEAELCALLAKFIPLHLLTEQQHIRGIWYQDKILVPQTDEDLSLQGEIEVDSRDGDPHYVRTLCIKVHAEPLLQIYSPVNLHHDARVLKLVLLNAIIHDFGHGVIDYIFEQFASFDDEAQYAPFYDWIIQLGLYYGASGTPVTAKSAGYLVNNAAIALAETDHERAQLGIERAQEDFAEMFRLRALYPGQYVAAMNYDGNSVKQSHFEKVWQG